MIVPGAAVKAARSSIAALTSASVASPADTMAAETSFRVSSDIVLDSPLASTFWARDNCGSPMPRSRKSW
jgi:hypothetical protein